ncbi:hypothetical protein RJ639_027036 [Escallonia herrerae]|uniref:Retrovirus-related Pol polyprotein from transposon TNT 1-94-like beta-barrel domain-containing protein n=1 Tax=Escallonia herrerae TaxID=1293975 RepID=A0AA88XIY0_9ASTE|nr:hypothetical protein RJ639_027036 [Escallonia herrerae]
MYDLEKFDGSNDFSLWRMKMRAVLIQQELLKALKGKQGLLDTMSNDEKEDMLERAHSALLLGEEHSDGLMARGRSTNHAGSRNKGRSRSQSKTRKLKYYHCHKEGYYRKDCPEHKGKKKDNSKTADAGVVEDNSDGADVLSVTISSSDGGWILDTGCSYNMCPNRDWFATYRSFDGGKVLMGNNVACKVVWIGSIQIMLHDGIVRTLTDVRHVPEQRKKLISLGMLDSNGCSYRAIGGVMRIMKGALIVMKENVTFDESSMLSKKKELIDAGKDHGVNEKVELEVRALDSLPKISTDEDDGSHSTEENEEPHEQKYYIARNRPRREI